jgi:hypothetical protein
VADVLDVTMRKRLSFYCYILPLLLGAGAWWFVSWLTTPRPLWTRTFQTDDFVVKDFNERLVTTDDGEQLLPVS